MSNVVEKIVDTYVQLDDSHALGDLKRYRQELAVLLKAQTGVNFSLLIDQIDAEIAMIEAGLDRLGHDTHVAWVALYPFYWRPGPSQTIGRKMMIAVNSTEIGVRRYRR
jgi:hypothetical protein